MSETFAYAEPSQPTIEDIDQIMSDRYALLSHGTTAVEFFLGATIVNPDTKKTEFVEGWVTSIKPAEAARIADALEYLENQATDPAEIIGCDIDRADLAKFAITLRTIATVEQD